MGYRPDLHGRGKALSCDKTTTGARLISSISLSRYNVHGYAVIRKGDKTTPCPGCGRAGVVIEGESRWKIMAVPVAVDRCEVRCGCPPGSNRIIAPVGQWMGPGPSPEQIAAEKQAAKEAAQRAENAKAAVADASVPGLIAGRAITSGTWAVKLGKIATSGPGAPVAAGIVGMMPGRLNDGEQDFIDRMRLAQMHEAPSRVRYTWEQDDQGNPVPHGWHTPPGKDMVRVRKMEWDSYRKKPVLKQQPRRQRKRRVLRIIFLFCRCRVFRRYIFIFAITPDRSRSRPEG